MKPLALSLAFLLACPSARAFAGAAAKTDKPTAGTAGDVHVGLPNPYCNTVGAYTYMVEDTSLKEHPGGEGSSFASPPGAVPGPDTIALGARPLIVRDQGDALLGADRSLSGDGSAAARLLIRTLALPAGDREEKCRFLPAPEQATSTERPQALRSQFNLRSIDYALIDVVRWKVDDGLPAVESDSWYLANFTDGSGQRRQFPFTFHPVTSADTLRIFGNRRHPERSRTLFLAVHLAPPGLRKPIASPGDERPIFFQAVKVAYTLHAEHVEPINLQHLDQLIALITGYTRPGTAKPPDRTSMLPPLPSPPPQFDGAYGVALLDNLADLPVDLTATMSATPAAPLTATLLGAAADAQPLNCSATAGSGCNTGKAGVGSAVAPETRAAPSPVTLSRTIHDEGLHHWDVGIGIPTPGYKESVFSGTTLQPASKSITRTNAYALFDYAPWGEDFYKPPLFGLPHLTAGLPLAGKVFNRPFFGLGESVGLSRGPLPFGVRFFGGVVWNKEFRGTAKTPVRVWKGMYGIEISVTSLVSAIKGK